MISLLLQLPPSLTTRYFELGVFMGRHVGRQVTPTTAVTVNAIGEKDLRYLHSPSSFRDVLAAEGFLDIDIRSTKHSDMIQGEAFR